ncbi:cytochrome P450 4C1-like [Helicoverpa armigera]|uniref:cytochrome P450 4C1-like n=1 Tax=Helicoverpa armigera TaxID=29058 RepID=UPI003083E30D
MFTVFLCVVVFILWSWLKPRHGAPPLIPGSLPLIGNSHQLIGDRKYLWKRSQRTGAICREMGGVAAFLVGSYSYYVISDPDDCLVVSNTCLDKPYAYNFSKRLMGNGLITSEASLWKVHRKLLNPAFSQQILTTFLHEINIQARSLVSQLSSKVGEEPFDVRSHFVKFTLSTVSRTSLGLSAEDQTIINNEYAETVEELFAVFCSRFQKVWLHLTCFYNMSALKQKEDQLLKTLRGIMDYVINKRKTELKVIEEPEITYDPNSGKFKPALDHLLNLAEEQDAFTDDEIREHLDTIVAASYDTTSSALTYTLILLGSHPEVQQRVVDELQEVLKNRDVDVSKDDLPKLVYLEAVIKESLRLYSVVPFIARKIDTHVKLKNYTLQPGTTCMILMHSIHRDTKLWGADADLFRPERWLDPETLPTHPNSFVPFGFGKRHCIGKLYTMFVMKTALAHILQRFSVSGNIDNVVTEYDIVLKPVLGHHISLSSRI